MVASIQATPESQAQMVKTKEDPLPNGTENIVTRSLQVGAATGALGLFWGTVGGIATGSKTPIIFTMANGLQWFGQGSMFYGSRYMLLARHGPVDKATAGQKIEASTLGAAISQATLMGLIRGRRSILPAAIVASLVGGGGQIAVNMWTSSRAQNTEQSSGGWLSAKWSPMMKLTDHEYENILEEKVLRLEAEIAIIDDKIAALRAQQADQTKVPPKAP
ncbi:unnamed protein product [Discula destructiva]